MVQFPEDSDSSSFLYLQPRLDRPMNSVACIVPYYKDQGTLIHTLRSLVAQTLPLDQIILINDGCNLSDREIGSIKDACQGFSGELIWVCLIQNSGVSTARNMGLGLCNSSHVAFCDSDEIWHIQKNELQMSILDNSPDLGLVCFEDMRSASPDLTTWESHQNRFSDLNIWEFILKNPIILSSVCCRFEPNIRFDERLVVAEDLNLWFCLIRQRRIKVRKYPIGMVFPLFGRYRMSGLSGHADKMLISLLAVFSFWCFKGSGDLRGRLAILVGLIFVVPRVMVSCCLRVYHGLCR